MTFSKHVVSMGADVEVFLKEKKTRRLASAIGLIGGTKEEPRWVRDGNLQEDNVLAEFAINPAVNENQFVGNIASVLSSLEDALPGHKLEVDSAKHMLPHHVAHPKAQEFGCDPDWDAWAMCERTPPDISSTITKQGRHLRTAGGHIHLGIEGIKEWDVAAKLIIGRALDAFVGIPIREADPKTHLRDKVYGGLGSVRVKPYGLEYRTPSNIWIKEEEYVRWMVRNCVKAVEFLFGSQRNMLFEQVTLTSTRKPREEVLKKLATNVGMEPFPSMKGESQSKNTVVSSGSSFTNVRIG